MNNLILEINLNYPGYFSYVPIKSESTKKELIDSFCNTVRDSRNEKIKIFSFCGYNFKVDHYVDISGNILEWLIPIYDIDEWFERFGNKVLVTDKV